MSVFTKCLPIDRLVLSLRLRKALLTADPDTVNWQEMAARLTDRSLLSLERLERSALRTLRRLHQSGRLADGDYQGWLSRLDSFSPDAVAEKLSPCHEVLQEKEFYRCADAPTRQALRQGLAVFAKRHRLSPADAALLWRGQSDPPSPKAALWLLLTLPLPAAAQVLLLRSLPAPANLLCLLTLPAMLAASWLTVSGLLLRCLPRQPLPCLAQRPRQALLTVCVGKAEEASAALQALSRIMADGSGQEFLLLLTLPDATAAEAAEDAALLQGLEQRVKALAAAADLTVHLQILPRRYTAEKFRKKRYRGTPTLSDLAKAIVTQIDQSETPPDGVCILPADQIPLPHGIAELSSTLFHPLCPVPILTFATAEGAVSPYRRLHRTRQALLQTLQAPADLMGWGIYRTDALRQIAAGNFPSARLSAQPLYPIAPHRPTLSLAPVRQAPSLLQTWRIALPLSRILLQVGLVIANPPLFALLWLWGIASVDLWLPALGALRWGSGFFLHTLPRWRRTANVFLRRTLLPIEALLPMHNSSSSPLLCLLSLTLGGGIIAIGTPLSFWGVLLCIAPLLQGEVRSLRDGTAHQKALCHAIAKGLLPHPAITRPGLPPAYYTADGSPAPYSTPSAIAFSMVATLSACDLGLIDPYTLERRLSALLQTAETLPLRGGLPYGRYCVDTGEFYESGRVDTAEAGLFALGLAVTEAGLYRHLSAHPALLLLAEKCLHLAEKMDFSLLFYPDGRLCRSLSPQAEREGVLSFLPVGYAALATPISEGAALPPLSQTHSQDSLSDCLLTAFLLPIPEGSPSAAQTSRNLSVLLNRTRGNCLGRLRKERTPSASLTVWASLCQADSTVALPPATALCLLLSQRPRKAMTELKKLRQTMGIEWFTLPDGSEQIPTLGIFLAMTALAGAVTEEGFSRRLCRIPRYGRLLPLLYRPFHREKAPLSAPAAVAEVSTSLHLFGDARKGLLIAKGECIALWHQGRLLTASAPAANPWSGGRASGLLLLQANRLLPLPHKLNTPTATFTDPCSATRISRTSCGWCICYERQESEPLDLRLVYCPSSAVRLSSGSYTDEAGEAGIFLSMAYAPDLTVTLAVSRLESPFAHADSAPLPQGRGQRSAIFAIEPIAPSGLCQTPTCILGGRLTEKAVQIRILLTATPSAAMALLQRPPSEIAPPAKCMPASDGYLLSRVMEWQLSPLFEGKPIPAAMAAGSLGSDYAQLERCLQEGAKQLTAKGFSLSEDSPIPLLVSRREGAEALLARLLAKEPIDAEVPLFPPTGSVTYTEAGMVIRQGRDLPPFIRTYCNGIARLTVMPQRICFRPYPHGEELSFSLYREQEGRRLLLPAAAPCITLTPTGVEGIGEDFTLQIGLLPRLPLLAIRMIGKGGLQIAESDLPPLYQATKGERLYGLSKDRLLFLRWLEGESESALLVGCFPKARDHLYYRIQSTVTLDTLLQRWAEAKTKLRSATALLQMQGEHARPLSYLAAVVLASDSPARGLLTPLCLPHQGLVDLIRLARSPASLLLPMVLARFGACGGKPEQLTLRIPTAEGKASLYFLAARALETAMEKDPSHPLLPPTVAAFATLAHRLGDHTGHDLYAAFVPPDPPLPWQKDTLPDASAQVITLLSDLYHGNAQAHKALWNAVCTLPLSLSPTDAALLWSGVLWSAQHPPSAPQKSKPPEKIWRVRKFSLQNGCNIHKNSVK